LRYQIKKERVRIGTQFESVVGDDGGFTKGGRGRGRDHRADPRRKQKTPGNRYSSGTT